MAISLFEGSASLCVGGQLDLLKILFLCKLNDMNSDPKNYWL